MDTQTDRHDRKLYLPAYAGGKKHYLPLYAGRKKAKPATHLVITKET